MTLSFSEYRIEEVWNMRHVCFNCSLSRCKPQQRRCRRDVILWFCEGIKVTYGNFDEMFCFDLGPLQIPHNLARSSTIQYGGRLIPKLNCSVLLISPKQSNTFYSFSQAAKGAKFFVEWPFCKQITVEIKVLLQIPFISRLMRNE